ncbi:MAG TPA: glycosyltransferase family 87 protein [Vicinamibacterales bacterium]|nr:glycosyltransferase family 87 protein [Vicinamibacterales bacterium]
MLGRAGPVQWPRSMVQAKGHAVVLAALMWTAAAVVGFAGSGDRGIAGPLKGADFVHFYTLGHLASAQQTEAIYNMTALHEAQVALVPASAPDLYPPVYPPQAAALFAPFSGWSYRSALLLWTSITIALYALIVWSAWTRVAGQLPDRTLVFAAAAAFPPFWSLIVYGQVTIVILVAFWAGWLALERRHHYLAGLAFGLLALKPQFGIPLAVIVLACGEWAMLAGAVSSVVAQAAAVWLMLGSSVFSGFAATVSATIAHEDWLEAKPFMSHSLRAVTRLLPNEVGLPLWIALAAAVLWYTVRVWKSDTPVRVRLGIVILASVLVNPHVIVYDVTLLVLPLIWFGAYMRGPERHARAPVFGATVYWLFAALFIPTAALIGVQMSVPLMMWLLVFVTRECDATCATDQYPQRTYSVGDPVP